MPGSAKKYIAIAIVNLIILTTLLSFWADDLEQTFNNSIRLTEFLKILGVTALSLIGMRILVYFFRKGNIQNNSIKLVSSILLTLLISSHLYATYSKKVINHVMINGEFRNNLSRKIKSANGPLANGTTAENLTFKEYQKIAEWIWLPKLPIEATNIMYNYQYDGFLPDYFLLLTYDLPQETKVEIINYENEDFSKYQNFKLLDRKKRVTYEESQR